MTTTPMTLVPNKVGSDGTNSSDASAIASQVVDPMFMNRVINIDRSETVNQTGTLPFY